MDEALVTALMLFHVLKKTPKSSFLLCSQLLAFLLGAILQGVYKCMFPSLIFLFPGYIKLIEQLA